MISLERLINKTEIFEKESFFVHILVIDQKVYCSNLFYTIQLFHSANDCCCNKQYESALSIALYK